MGPSGTEVSPGALRSQRNGHLISPRAAPEEHLSTGGLGYFAMTYGVEPRRVATLRDYPLLLNE